MMPVLRTCRSLKRLQAWPLWRKSQCLNNLLHIYTLGLKLILDLKPILMEIIWVFGVIHPYFQVGMAVAAGWTAGNRPAQPPWLQWEIAKRGSDMQLSETKKKGLLVINKLFCLSIQKYSCNLTNQHEERINDQESNGSCCKAIGGFCGKLE